MSSFHDTHEYVYFKANPNVGDLILVNHLYGKSSVMGTCINYARNECEVVMPNGEMIHFRHEESGKWNLDRHLFVLKQGEKEAL